MFYFKPKNAELFLFKPWRLKHDRLSTSAADGHRRQILTYKDDIRGERAKKRPT